MSTHNRIIIELEGGLVQGVIVHPLEEFELEVYTVDFDVEGADEADIIRFKRPDSDLESKAWVGEPELVAARGKTDAEAAVAAHLDKAKRLPLVVKTYPVEFALLYDDRTWDTRSYDVPETVGDDDLRGWFEQEVLSVWPQDGRVVAGFDVYHKGEAKEE